VLGEATRSDCWEAETTPIESRVELLTAGWPRLNAPPSALEAAWRLWVPLALDIDRRCRSGTLFCQGILGPQGSGKSTLAGALTVLLAHLGQRAVDLSIDDLYLTASERRRLRTERPALRWRGPPGTHDVALGVRTLEALRSGQAPFWLPRFDKAAGGGEGDRHAWVELRPEITLTGPVRAGHFFLERCRVQGLDLPLPENMGSPVPLDFLDGVPADGWAVWSREEGEARLQMAEGVWSVAVDGLPVGWQVLTARPDAVIFEGWCVGVRPVLRELSEEDLAGQSNRELAAYEALWEFLDQLLVLKPGDLDWSRQWRWTAERERIGRGQGGMSAAEIARFVEYFQHALPWATFVEPLIASGRCDLVVEIDAEHNPGRIWRPGGGLER
jgi:D-glycerate 3-kinase